jgi:hypothetical protein
LAAALPSSLAEEPIVRPVVPGQARELAFHCDEEPAAGPRRKAAVREVLATARAGGHSRRPIGKARFASPLTAEIHGPRPGAPQKVRDPSSEEFRGPGLPTAGREA